MSAILRESRQLFSEAVSFHFNTFSYAQCSLKYNLNIKNTFLERLLVSLVTPKKIEKCFVNTFFCLF